MPFIVRGTPSHDILPGVSTADHHTATVAGDLNLADLAERSHLSLTPVTVNDHLFDSPQTSFESESAIQGAVRPSRIRFSPGVAKAACHITAAGLLSVPDYNVASITDTGTGDRIIVWDADFTSVIYFPVTQQTDEGPSTNHASESQHTLAVGSMVLEMASQDGTSLADVASATIVLGVQV